MVSHYTWGSVTTLDDFGGMLGQPLDTFFWAFTIWWSRLLAHVWSGPKPQVEFTSLDPCCLGVCVWHLCIWMNDPRQTSIHKTLERQLHHYLSIHSCWWQTLQGTYNRRCQCQHLTQNHHPRILHKQYILIMRMSATLTSNSRVGFGPIINDFLKLLYNMWIQNLNKTHFDVMFKSLFNQ